MYLECDTWMDRLSFGKTRNEPVSGSGFLIRDDYQTWTYLKHRLAWIILRLLVWRQSGVVVSVVGHMTACQLPLPASAANPPAPYTASACGLNVMADVAPVRTSSPSVSFCPRHSARMMFERVVSCPSVGIYRLPELLMCDWNQPTNYGDGGYSQHSC